MARRTGNQGWPKQLLGEAKITSHTGNRRTQCNRQGACYNIKARRGVPCVPPMHLLWEKNNARGSRQRTTRRVRQPGRSVFDCGEIGAESLPNGVHLGTEGSMTTKKKGGGATKSPPNLKSLKKRRSSTTDTGKKTNGGKGRLRWEKPKVPRKVRVDEG